MIRSCTKMRLSTEWKKPMTLFESVANSRCVSCLLSSFQLIGLLRWFTKTSIILFLNKIDLFRAKLASSPLSNTFPNYRGGASYEAACAFLLEKFVSLNKNPAKSIYAVGATSFLSIIPDHYTIKSTSSSDSAIHSFVAKADVA